MLNRLQAAWRRAVPDEPFVAQTADERLEEFYKPDQQHARLFSGGAVLAIAIACIGLYGLAAFSTTRRVREIGIRKTLGASTQGLLLLLVGQFTRPVLLANLIAWPLAWAAMRAWLSGFDERIAPRHIRRWREQLCSSLSGESDHSCRHQQMTAHRPKAFSTQPTFCQLRFRDVSSIEGRALGARWLYPLPARR